MYLRTSGQPYLSRAWQIEAVRAAATEAQAVHEARENSGGEQHAELEACKVGTPFSYPFPLHGPTALRCDALHPIEQVELSRDEIEKVMLKD